MSNVAFRVVRRLLLLAALAVPAGACEFVFDADDSEARELERARDRWRRKGPSDYRYDFQKYCFCGGADLRPVTVHVRNGAVYDAVYADNGELVPDEYLRFYRTIDGLFEVIGNAINRHADDLDVDYDEQYGYPRSVEIDYDYRTADDEVYFTVRRFRPGRF
ncbi:MAG TPA: DUF6174 domain-containing protein [Longimicrobiales bacterium]